MSGGDETKATSSVNVRRNLTLNLLSASHTITQSRAWVPATVLQNQNFGVGDTMDVILLSSSYYPQQVSVQINLTRE
jgi:hypothetical protein